MAWVTALQGKRINKRDSERILSHIQKAREIIDKYEADGYTATMEPTCAAQILSILGAIEGTAYDSMED